MATGAVTRRLAIGAVTRRMATGARTRRACAGSITPDRLPPPSPARPPPGNPSVVAARPPGALPQVPAGFSVTLFASGLDRAADRSARRRTATSSSPRARRRPRPRARAPRRRRARPRPPHVFAAGLDRPFGIAFYPPGPDPRFVYVATTDQVVRFPYRSGDLAASRPGRGRRARSAGRRPLDPRRRLLAGRQDVVRLGRLGLQRRRDLPRAAGRRRKPPSPRRTPSAPPGAPRSGRADVLAFDPDGGDGASSRPACAIAPAWRSSPPPARCGARSTSATGSATTCRPTTRPSVAEGALLRLAVVLHRRPRGPAPRGARPDLAAQVDRRPTC